MEEVNHSNLAPLATVAAAIVFVVLSCYYYYENTFTYWKKRGVRGPRPLLLGGNMLSILFFNRFEVEMRWFKKFGKVYAFYENVKPTLIVADPEVMRQICIRDFHAFVNHDELNFTNKYQDSFLISLRDEHWKRVRSIMSPTFTSGKIKRMFKLLDLCADDLVLLFKDQLKSESGELKAKVNLKDLFGMYTMDAITSCCFALKLGRDGSTNLQMAASQNEFVYNALKVFQFELKRMLLFFLCNKSILEWFGFEFLPETHLKPLANRVEQLVNHRRSTQKKFDDYLQLLIDARVGDKMQLNETDAKENHHADLTHESLIRDQEQMAAEAQDQVLGPKYMTDTEMLSNATFLLVVGLETTASLLAFCTYSLAFHPQVQERLYKEVKAIARYVDSKSVPIFDYEELTSCQYLDAVVSETLRRFPAGIVTDRSAKEDYFIEKYNILVPKGTKLTMQLYLIMNDPDNWVEPEKFDPERFMPGNRDLIVPGSYCPFGLGPRHCVGMRFSLTESKLALAKMIMEFNIEPAPATSFPPEPKMNLGLNDMKRPFVIMKPRIDADNQR